MNHKQGTMPSNQTRESPRSKALSKELAQHIIKHLKSQGLKNSDIARLSRVHTSVISKIIHGNRRLSIIHLQSIVKALKQRLPLFLLAALPEPSPHDKSHEVYMAIREIYLASDQFRAYLDELQCHALPDKRKIKAKKRGTYRKL